MDPICSGCLDMDPMKNGFLRHGSNMWWIVAYLQPQTVVGSRCASCRWDNSDQSGSSGPSSCWTPLPWVGMCENCNFLFQMPGYLCYSDVCSSRGDHDEIVVAHGHILVLDNVGRRLTSGTVPSTNSTFVLLLKNASFKCTMADSITKYKIYLDIFTSHQQKESVWRAGPIINHYPLLCLLIFSFSLPLVYITSVLLPKFPSQPTGMHSPSTQIRRPSSSQDVPSTTYVVIYIYLPI